MSMVSGLKRVETGARETDQNAKLNAKADKQDASLLKPNPWIRPSQLTTTNQN